MHLLALTDIMLPPFSLCHSSVTPCQSRVLVTYNNHTFWVHSIPQVRALLLRALNQYQFEQRQPYSEEVLRQAIDVVQAQLDSVRV